MVEFKREHGHANPVKSINSTDAESKLGRWLKDQRKIFESGRLVAERVKQLRRLGCDGFETAHGAEEDAGDRSVAENEAKENEAKVRSHSDSQWEARFVQLLAFKKESGHANPVRSKFAATTEFSLASWVTTQRMKFREGKLDNDRIERLRSVGCKGFVEEHYDNHDSVSEDGTAQKAVNPTNDTQWENRYNQLAEFKKKNGHADPKRSQGADSTEYKLGSFLTAQRMKYRDGTLERHRLLKLRGLGCYGFGAIQDPQELTVRRTWEQHFENLKEYKEQHGHANPRRSQGPWFELGNWLASQRVRFRKGSLRMEKAELLRSLGCSGFDEESDFIEEPGPNDVVCGRGGHTNAWPGNVRFREHVHSRKDEYWASKKHRKKEISREVVSYVRQAGGRFLKHDHGVWVEVGDAVSLFREEALGGTANMQLTS
jgi:Helicase associated domain